MAVTRRCPSCDRPNGPKFRACMYCGAPLEATDAPPEPPTEELDPAARAERARALLDALTPKARSMMPPSALAKLEADIRAGEPMAPEVEPPPRPVTAPSAPSPVPPPPPEPDPSAADLPSANQEEGRGHFEAALLDALGRGGGPFGPRQVSWRLVLQPSASYREGLPWLRERLARITGLDLYTATQNLQRPVPSCIASNDHRPLLASMAQELADGGLLVELLERRVWARERLPLLVQDIEDLDADPLVLWLADGSWIRVARERLRVALVAEISPSRTKVPEVERSRLGLPVKPQRASLEDRFSPYIAMDLWVAGQKRPLRIRSSEFDFRRLGDDREFAATLNMRVLARRLSPAVGPVAVDDGFRRVPVLPGPLDREQGGSVKPGTVPRRAIDFTEYSILRGLALEPR